MMPAVNAALRISGNVTFNFWASSTTDNWSMQLTASLNDSADLVPGGDTQIGTATITEAMPYAWTLHNITIPSVTYILPAGHTLILHMLRANIGGGSIRLYVFYDQTTPLLMDSTLVIPVISHFNISSYGSRGIDGIPRTEFGNQETIWAFANVTDAIGAYDIRNSTLVVKNDTGATIISKQMSISSSGPAALPSWRLYLESFGPLPKGNYSMNITAIDNSNNAFWSEWTIRVLSIDHFNVVSSTNKVRAGDPFSVTIEVIDTNGNRMKNWSGIVSLQAIDNQTGFPISGLSNTSVFMSSADKGIATFSENFTLAPKTIRVKATNGSSTGQSQAIDVNPGPIFGLKVEPSDVTLQAGTTVLLTANATDRFGNRNISWQPYWYMTQANGTLSPNGMNVQLRGLLVGYVALYCKDNLSSKEFKVDVNITIAGLANIVVTPASSTVWEGRSTAITAMGFDAFGNPISIPAAVWSSEGFAMSWLTGSGQNGMLFAGMAPEAGLVRVTSGAISGIAQISVVCPPWGPTLGALPNQVGYEDTSWSVDLSLYWSDPNGTSGLSWYVTGVNDSLIVISHDMSSPSIVNIIPQPNANGINLVTFWVRDPPPTGYTNYKQISITVLPVNDAPAFINDPPTELYVKFNLAYSFNYSYYVEDVDNSKSQLILSADPSTYIVSSGLTLTYTFPDRDNGQPYYTLITLVVSDGSLSDSLTIKVWATSDTPPDMIKPLPDVTINEGDLNVRVFDLDDYFTDVDGDVLYYTKGFEHVEIKIDPTSHEVFVSSPSEWSGQTTAVFVAHDPTGAIRIDAITITVIPVNDPPEISAMQTVYVRYDVVYWLDLRLYVSDPDNGLNELTISTSNPANATYVSIPYPHLELRYPAKLGGGAYAGPYDVSVQLHVADPGGLQADRSFTIRVSDNYPPVLTRIPPEVIGFLEDTYLDKPYSLDLEALFADPDAEVLAFNFSGNSNVTIVIGADGWVNFSAPPNWYGAEFVIFNATDPHGAWVSFKMRVDVISVNDPPVLTTIPDVYHTGSRSWSMSIESFISDVDTDLSKIEVIIVQPGYVKAVGHTLYFELPDGVDSATVIIYVSDGQANSNMVTFHIYYQKSLEEIIPWSLVAVLLAAGIIGYLLAFRILPHKLQELFLIHNDGRLVYHAGKDGTGNGMDQDVVSAMFTAVQDFIRDSFKEESGALKMLEVGDRKVVIEKGKWIYAALIYNGWPPKSVFRNLTHFVKDIEGAYGNSIEHWDGTLKALPGIQAISQEMLDKKYHAGEANHTRNSGIARAQKLEDLKAESPSPGDLEKK